MTKKLTAKQQRFCEEYVIDWNGTRAVIAAGYSENAAAEIAYEYLRKPHIKEYINKIRNDLSRLSGITALRNLIELKKIAYSSIAHLHNTWITLKEFEDLTDDQKACIESIDTKTEIKTVQGGDFDKELFEIETKYIKIKLFSKLTAIETINRMLGFNAPEKHENKDVDEFSNYSDEELDQYINDFDKGTKDTKSKGHKGKTKTIKQK